MSEPIDLKKERGYALGERNPNTLGHEDDYTNRKKTQYWREVRKWTEHSSAGWKY